MPRATRLGKTKLKFVLFQTWLGPVALDPLSSRGCSAGREERDSSRVTFALQPFSVYQSRLTAHMESVVCVSTQRVADSRVSSWMFWLVEREHSGFLKLGLW